MDPNANHARQVELALAIRRALDAGVDLELVSRMADELAENVIALNDWVGNGGFWPSKGSR